MADWRTRVPQRNGGIEIAIKRALGLIFIALLLPCNRVSPCRMWRRGVWLLRACVGKGESGVCHWVSPWGLWISITPLGGGWRGWWTVFTAVYWYSSFFNLFFILLPSWVCFIRRRREGIVGRGGIFFTSLTSLSLFPLSSSSSSCFVSSVPFFFLCLLLHPSFPFQFHPCFAFFLFSLPWFLVIFFHSLSSLSTISSSSFFLSLFLFSHLYSCFPPLSSVTLHLYFPSSKETDI